MKKLKYCIGVPTINRLDLLKESIFDIKTNQPNAELIVIDNGNQEGIKNLLLDNISNFTLCSNSKNIGVSGSWNSICLNAFYLLKYDCVLIINDDIVLGKAENEINILAEKAITNDVFMTQCGTWCVFMLTKKIFEKIGYFDESIFPAYFEDNDYSYRLKLNEVPQISTNELCPIIYRNSMTIAKDNSLNVNFEKNKRYYIEKWGGEPRKETFTKPFNK
jgi:GT2 family glycosyltransferase